MKKINVLLAALALMVAGSAAAKDIRVVEISMDSGMSSRSDNSITSVLGTIAGVSKIVSDVANLILTVTYDADQIGVDDIVSSINKKEPSMKAKQKSEPKTKKWVKAEKKMEKAEQKVEKEKQEAQERDNERQKSSQGSTNNSGQGNQGGNGNGGQSGNSGGPSGNSGQAKR